VANTKYAERLAQEVAEQEIAEGWVAELEWRVLEIMSENVQMKKAMAELDKNFDDTLELLNQSFFQVVY